MSFLKIVKVVASKVASLVNHCSGWNWIGDESTDLFERRITHVELEVRARLGVDHETCVDKNFSETWVPGAVLLHPKWKEQVGEDIQWYVPRREYRFGFQTGGAVTEMVASLKKFMSDMQSDVEIYVGERTLYQVTLDVYYNGVLVASQVQKNLDVQFDVVNLNMRPVDEIVASMLPDAVNAARSHRRYLAMSLAAA